MPREEGVRRQGRQGSATWVLESSSWSVTVSEPDHSEKDGNEELGYTPPVFEARSPSRIGRCLSLPCPVWFSSSYNQKKAIMLMLTSCSLFDLL